MTQNDIKICFLSGLLRLTRISYLLIIFIGLINGVGQANLLTNQQINLLLANDDIQVFTPDSNVKKVTLSIIYSTDNSQGKTIAEYSKAGLLDNYYQVSVVKDDQNPLTRHQNTLITTLINIDNGKWQRKQTLDTFEIDNTLYTLKNGNVSMVVMSSDINNQQIIKQHIQPLNNPTGKMVNFSYNTTPSYGQLNIDYLFNQHDLLSHYHYFIIDRYGNKSNVKLNFHYDKQQRLIRCNEKDSYQPINQVSEKKSGYISYDDFDYFGNWQTKIEKMLSQTVIYRRTIEYW